MQNNETTFGDAVADAPSTVSGKLAAAQEKVKDKVSDLAHTAASKIDENRGAAATGLENAASTIHAKGDKVADLAHGAADKLSSTADYVRRNDFNRMMSDVEEVVKNNPGPALLGAIAIGFLMGRAFTSND